MVGSSKGGRRRPFRCLPQHTLSLLLFMAYWTAAFSAVPATGQTQVASSARMENENRRKAAQIGVGGRPPGITVAMSPSLPSSSCQLALASLKVHLLYLPPPHLFSYHTQFVPLWQLCHQDYDVYQSTHLCVLLRVAKCTLLAEMGVEVKVEWVLLARSSAWADPNGAMSHCHFGRTTSPCHTRLPVLTILTLPLMVTTVRGH